MHNEIKRLLADAEGKSEYIIALFIDIRGFSAFSKTIDSTLSAIFIKKFYLKLINDYYSNASFFKPTGDGLLIIVPTNEKNLKEDINSVVNDSLDIISNFSHFFDEDEMITFPIPEKVGIGIARGPACSLVSANKIIDFSGDTLNKAARLMDVARPTGIVFDINFGLKNLPEDKQKLFSKDKVFIKGLAEIEPMEIYYTKDYTNISPLIKIPPNDIKWEQKNIVEKFSNFLSVPSVFIHKLDKKPLDSNKIQIRVIYPRIINNRIVKKRAAFWDYKNFVYQEIAGKPQVTVDYQPIKEKLLAAGVKKQHKVQLQINYQVL